MSPLVSVIVPCYNQAQFLPEALNSVLSQTYINWECVIVNDGSSDNTEEVALKYCELDERFIYVFKENGGLSSARNFGIKASKGVFILPLDSDDLIGSLYIIKAVERFIKYSNTKLVYCKAQLFGDENGEWKLEDYSYDSLLLENSIFCSSMYKREDYDKTTGYNEQLKEGLEDWDFWLSLLSREDIVFRIPDICFYYRIRGNSMLREMTEPVLMSLYKKIYFNHQEKYDEIISNVIWLNSKIKSQHDRIVFLELENHRILKTKSYMIGRMILSPFKFIKNTFKYSK
jgi:glycosyltransferase involved in cell wall biosynthesis